MTTYEKNAKPGTGSTDSLGLNRTAAPPQQTTERATSVAANTSDDHVATPSAQASDQTPPTSEPV